MALGEPTRDRRSERRAATTAEIVDAAWRLVRQSGLAGLSLRDLAAAVGMQPPSLYSYFPSKHAIYDAMFADGYRALIARRDELAPVTSRASFKAGARAFVDFCTTDPARYQLLFQRTVPGFEPSAESMALAREALGWAADALAAVGVDDPRALDLYTALITGITDQQISNDPGGDRWSRLLADAIDMFLAHVAPTKRRRT
jgi:AcrR family transcriptional regulator